jgi:hypothetical protein
MPKYHVRVTYLPDKALTGLVLMKSLRMVGGLGLGQARQLYRYLVVADDEQERYINLPCVLIAGIDRQVADHAANLLREAGATVEVEECSIPNPMLLSPQAAYRYGWNWLIGPCRIHEGQGTGDE